MAGMSSVWSRYQQVTESLIFGNPHGLEEEQSTIVPADIVTSESYESVTTTDIVRSDRINTGIEFNETSTVPGKMTTSFFDADMSTMVNSTFGDSNGTESPILDPLRPGTGQIIIASVLLVITSVTILGNTLVIISPFTDRKLRNTFTYYIINLGVTDFLVATSAMSFYSIDIMLGYWPFGEVMCGVWIFFDYGMTFASVFTLVVISVDRYWSVGWGLHYRSHNTPKKCAIMITTVWLAVLAVWLAPCIIDRIRWSEPGICKWEPSNNKDFVIFVAVVGHHTPCAVIIFCYYKIYMIMRAKKRSVAPAVSVATSATVKEANTVQISEKVENSNQGTAVAERSKMHLTIPILPDNTTIFNTQASSHKNGENIIIDTPSTNSSQPPDAHSIIAERKRKKEDKEKKAFVMLSYILFSYLACWVPFHIIFDISSIRPDLVPEWVYTTTFYLTYLNSTINPFVYAFTSSSFRKAFLKIIWCDISCRK